VIKTIPSNKNSRFCHKYIKWKKMEEEKILENGITGVILE